MNTTPLLFLALLILPAAIAVPAFGQQSPHAVVLQWTAAPNQPGQTFAVYRAPGLCTGNPVFAKVAEGVAVETFEDQTVTTGNYCFHVTAVWQGMESVPSNRVLVPIPASPPTALIFTIR